MSSALKPRLVFESEQHDFGLVDDASRPTATLAFRNEGSAALTIVRVDTTCGCTAAKLDKMQYEPGEGGELEVSLKTEGKKNRVTQYVTVTSDDPDRPTQRLEVRADVVQLVDVSVRTVNFGKIERGVASKQTIVVTGPSEEFVVTAARSTRPDVFDLKILQPREAEIFDRLSGGQKRAVAQYVVEVTPGANIPAGQASATLVLSTNLEARPEIQIGANAFVKGDVQIGEPGRLSFGGVKAGDPIDLTVRVESRSGTPFEIKKMVEMIPVGKKLLESVEIELIPVPETAVELEQDDDDDSEPVVRYTAYDLTVKGTAPATPMPVRGFIVLNTDARGQPVVRVNLSGVVRR
ncbi:MAG: DUF1573 domain-containing protein [Planctomycetota bacterium]